MPVIPPDPVVPAAVGVVAGIAGVATLLPQTADFFVIGVAAVCGAAIQLSSKSRIDGKKIERLEALVYIIITTVAALLITGPVSLLLENLIHVKHEYTGTLIALLIGARREQLLDGATRFSKKGD